MKYETEGDLATKLSLGYRATTSKHITPDRLTEITAILKTSNKNTPPTPR